MGCVKMTVYDALEKRHVMPRAWDDWADYRKNWSDFIIRHCKWDTRILIVGAGACNDYDLEHFSKFFREILLFDMDEKMLQEALKRVPKERRAKFGVYTGDLLGITPAEYQEFCRVVQEEVNHRGKLTDVRELADSMLRHVELMYAQAGRRRQKLQLPQADYVAVSGVHSQVNHMLPWIWEAYMQALGQREDLIFRRAAQENELIVKDMNSRLLAAAKRGLFVSAEKTRMGVPGGVEGACQALADLHQRADAKQVHLLNETKIAWGYDLRQQMIYEMEALAISTNPPVQDVKTDETK